MGMAGSVFQVLALVPNPLGPIAGSLAAGCGLCAVAANQFANDPPRTDFRTRTDLSPGVIPVEGLVDSPLDLPPPPQLLGLAADINESHANLQSLIRSFERAQGAQAARDASAVDRRLGESRDFVHRTSSALRSLGEHFSEFSVSFPNYFDPIPGLPHSDQPRPADLPPTNLASIYLAGMPLSLLTRGFNGVNKFAETRPVLNQSTFSATAEASLELASTLRGWEPRL